MLSKDFLERVQDCTLTMFNQGKEHQRMGPSLANQSGRDQYRVHEDAWTLQFPLSGLWEEKNGTWANGRSTATGGTSLPQSGKLIRVEHDVGKGDIKARPPSSVSSIAVNR
jgi:hypothetical protein